MRHDDRLMFGIKQHCPPQAYEKLRNLPFFYFDLHPEEYFKEPYISQNLEEFGNLLPFNDFLVMNQVQGILHHISYDVEKNIMIVEDFYNPKHQDKFYAYVNNTKNMPKMVSQIHVLSMNSDSGSFDVRMAYMGFLKGKVLTGKESEYMNLLEISLEETKQAIMNDLRAEISLVDHCLHEAEEKSLHLVRVTKQTHTSNGKRIPKAARDYSPQFHYVYMDCPHPPESESTGEGTPKRGHHRRAYWRKLSHPKFKNHPKFGQKIRVKACWVGPVEWADSGKIYTLHEYSKHES